MSRQFNEGIYSFPQMVLEQLFIYMKKKTEKKKTRKEKEKEKKKGICIPISHNM